MGVNRVTKRGKTRWEVRRRWPDRTTFRRFYPNRALAEKMHLRIEVAVAEGKWRELKEQQSREPSNGPETVEGFSDLYLAHCEVRNRRPDFKVQAFASINRIVGKIRLKDFTRAHADRFVAIRSKEVAPATINRGLAVLKHMFSFAVERGYLETNPLSGYKALPEEQIPRRIMTLQEERRLIEHVANRNFVIGAYVALLGETGLRRSEGLKMRWEDVDFDRRMLTVPKSKTGQPRYVPLSDYAVQWLKSLPRYRGCPQVFALDADRPLKEPSDALERGKKDAGLEFVRGFHDLRHFRATQWLNHGVDIQSVKKYLGHLRIETTQRYLHFVSDHAEAAVRRAQRSEEAELRAGASRIRFGAWETSGRQPFDSSTQLEQGVALSD